MLGGAHTIKRTGKFKNDIPAVKALAHVDV